MNFEKDADRVHDAIEEVYESYVFVGKGKGTKKGCVAMHGSDADLITHLSKAYKDVKAAVAKNNDDNEDLANEMMKAVYLTPDELQKEILKTLMEKLHEAFQSVEDDEEKEDDDAEDESCDCDDESEEDDSRGCISPETTEEKAHRKAFEEFCKSLGNNGDDDLSFDVSGHVHRRKPRG